MGGGSWQDRNVRRSWLGGRSAQWHIIAIGVVADAYRISVGSRMGNPEPQDWCSTRRSLRGIGNRATVLPHAQVYEPASTWARLSLDDNPLRGFSGRGSKHLAAASVANSQGPLRTGTASRSVIGFRGVAFPTYWSCPWHRMMVAEGWKADPGLPSIEAAAIRRAVPSPCHSCQLCPVLVSNKYTLGLS